MVDYMKCTICGDEFDENLIAEHFTENHFEVTFRALNDMYSVSIEDMVVDSIKEYYEEVEEEEDE